MTVMAKQYLKEVKDQAVRLVLDHGHDHDQIVLRLVRLRPDSILAQSLRTWVNRPEVDTGARPGVVSTFQVLMKGVGKTGS
jgi:hypothetical protein